MGHEEPVVAELREGQGCIYASIFHALDWTVEVVIANDQTDVYVHRQVFDSPVVCVVASWKALDMSTLVTTMTRSRYSPREPELGKRNAVSALRRRCGDMAKPGVDSLADVQFNPSPVAVEDW